MLGVLKIILRRNLVAARGFGASQRQIALIASLCILRRGVSGRFGFPNLRLSPAFSCLGAAAPLRGHVSP